MFSEWKRRMSSADTWTTQVDLTLNITERKTGGLSAGGGISAQGYGEGAIPGFIGSCSYSQRNLFGLNQKLTATVELGQVLHALNFTVSRLPACLPTHMGTMFRVSQAKPP